MVLCNQNTRTSIKKLSNVFSSPSSCNLNDRGSRSLFLNDVVFPILLDWKCVALQTLKVRFTANETRHAMCTSYAYAEICEQQQTNLRLNIKATIKKCPYAVQKILGVYKSPKMILIIIMQFS